MFIISLIEKNKVLGVWVSHTPFLLYPDFHFMQKKDGHYDRLLLVKLKNRYNVFG